MNFLVRITPADAGTRDSMRFVNWVSVGITPADAGTSSKNRSHVLYSADHPRGCGDKATGPPLFKRTLGSPPRMRGQATIF